MYFKSLGQKKSLVQKKNDVKFESKDQVYGGPSLSLHFTTCKLKCMWYFAFKWNFISSLSFDFKFNLKQKLNFYFICYFKCVCKVILKNINIFRANYNHEIHIFLKINIKLLINKKIWNTIIRFGRQKKIWKAQRYRVTEGIK